MLKKIEISTFEDRVPYLTAGSKKGLYIVSDIKSKIQFQNFFLQKNPHLQTDFIQRAVDFYCSLFKTYQPNYQIISPARLELLFKIYIKKTNYSWLKNTPGHQTILHSLHTFLPFFTHTEGAESFESWMKHSAKRKGWVHWYEPTKKFWKELKKNKLIEKSLTKYLLIDQPLRIKNPLIIDLSFSIDSVEAGLITSLSKVQDVTLLLPPKLANPVYSKSHYFYSLIEESSPSPKKTDKIRQNSFHPKQVGKFQTMLEEVRFVTEQLSLSIKNVKPSELAVLAPDMELYWPCLKSYLKKENIPVKKGLRVSLFSFPQVQKWLSVLHFYTGQISFENVADVLHWTQKKRDISQVKSKYYYCNRDTDIENFDYPKDNKLGKFLSADEFSKWISDFWNSIIQQHPNSKLNECIQTILQQISPIQNMFEKASAEDWMEILERELAQEEFHIPSTQNQGVELMSINAITSLRAKKVFIIGLSHENCCTSSKTFFSEKEGNQILQDLGFHCPTIDPNQREYEVVHFLNSFKGPVFLSYSETNFEGGSLTPSRIWLMENTEKNALPLEKSIHTRWTALQKKPLGEIMQNFPLCSAHQIEQILTQEIPWPTDQKIQVKNLSPSKIKDYASCPFIFLAKNLFQLKDISYQDRDLDYKDYGQIIHELFHQIKQGGIQNKQEALHWIQSIQPKFHIMDNEIWQAYSEQFIKKYFQFIEHEKTITQSLKGIKTTDTEWEFKIYWNLEKEELDESKGDILIEGRIDRIDQFQDEYLIIDYKSSFNNIVNISHWEKKLDFQMPLYMGAVSLIKKQGVVSSALYLSYKDFKWKGFISKDSKLKKLSPSSRMIYNIDKKEMILKNINQSIQKNILNLKENIFKPKPFDKKICSHCYWRNICRVPHLN